MQLKKFKKIICVFSAVFISVFSFCISASAASSPYDVENPIRMSIGQPPAGDNSGYVELLSKNSSGGYGFRVLYWTICPDNAEDSSTFPLCMNLKISSNSITFTVPDNAQDLTFSNVCVFASNGTYFYRLLNFNNDYSYTYSSDSSIVGFHVYGNYNILSNSVSNGENFYVTYAGDSVIFTVLRELNIILGQIGDSLGNTSGQIIANDDKNMDELKNGWSDNKDIDSSEVSEFEGAQDNLLNDTSQGRNDLVNAFGNIGNSFIYRCLYASTSIFNEFLGVSWLSDIIQFSLVLGVFAFLIGAVSIVVGRVSSSEGHPKRRNDYKNSDKDKK